MGYRRIRSVLCDQLRAFKPDLIISDFEPFLPRAARSLGIPVLQMSHQVVLHSGRVPVPPKYLMSFFKAYFVSRIMIGSFQYGAGISFFRVPLKKADAPVAILPPIMRCELMSGREEGEHILVYLSCSAFDWLGEHFARYPQHHFIVYGFEEQQQRAFPNVSYKAISPTTFTQDLKKAKAIITNGGHNLISEAGYLGVPILSFWVAGQFEQYLNAWFVEMMGLGRMVEKIHDTDWIMAAFFKELEAGHFQAKHLEVGNQPVRDLVHRLIQQNQNQEISKPISHLADI